LGNVARAVGDITFSNWNGRDITVNYESNRSTCVRRISVFIYQTFHTQDRKMIPHINLQIERLDPTVLML